MILGLNLSTLVVLLIGGIILDAMLGEVRRWHPLVGFGRIAGWLEKRLNVGQWRFARGLLAWILAVLPPVALAVWLASAGGVAAVVLHVLLLYFSLGLRSLREHTQPIEQALAQGDLDKARQLTSRIVSRDTQHADSDALAKAAVESLLENGNDAVFGTLFWFVVAGGPGALLFRLSNTLDAMWGYRTLRFLAFGCVAARIDDVLNLIPARLTALSYTLLGDSRRAWLCWRTQARAWSSPNAGPVMASGSGALGLMLGGHACYDGVDEVRPPLGNGRAAQAADIGRCWRLVRGSVLLWVCALCAAALIERMLHA